MGKVNPTAEQKRTLGAVKVWRVPPTDWVPPKDMHPQLAKYVILGKACGAKLKYGDGYCGQAPALSGLRRIRSGPPPYRCRFHGGMNPGAPVGSQNAAKKVLGLYANLLRPGEEQWLEQLAADDLSFEISMMKMRLRRIAEAEEQFEEQAKLQVVEESTRYSDPNIGQLSLADIARGKRPIPPRKSGAKPPPPGKCLVRRRLVISEKYVVRRAPDFKNAMAVAARHLVKMMETQAVLKGKGGFSDEQKKELARSFIKEVKAQGQGAGRPDVPGEYKRRRKPKEQA